MRNGGVGVTYPKGARVVVTMDPTGGMAGTPVGTRGRITSGGSAIVSVKFANGVSAQCWMTSTRDGTPTLQVVG